MTTEIIDGESPAESRPRRLSREVLSSAAVYSGAGILEKLVSFLLLPFYAHIFQTQGYSVIGLVDASVGLLTIAFSNGFHTSTVRVYYEEPPGRQGRVVSTAILVLWAFGLIVVPLPMLASPWLARVLLGNADYAVLIVIALVTLLIDVGGKAASTYLVIRRRSVLYSTINLCRMLIAVSLNVLLVLVLRVGIIGIFISSLVTAAITAVVYVGLALRDTGLEFDWDIARRLCAFEFPLIPAEVVAFASRQTERFLVRFMVSFDSVGVLEMAYKFPPMLNMFFVAPFMLSWRIKSVEVGEEEDAPRFMGRMLTAYFFLIAFGGLLLAADIGPLLVVLTPEGFWRAASIARIEVVTTILAGLGTFMQFGMMYCKRTSRLAVIKSSVAVGKVVASVLIIRNFGLSGAAYSALIMESVTLAWVSAESQSLYRIEIEARRLAALAAGAVGLFIVVGYVDGLAAGPLDIVSRDAVPILVALVRHSPLALLRSGTLVGFLAGKERALAELILNTAIAASYVTAVPLVHPATVRDLATYFRKGRAIVTPAA